MIALWEVKPTLHRCESLKCQNQSRILISSKLELCCTSLCFVFFLLSIEKLVDQWNSKVYFHSLGADSSLF